MGSLRGLRQAAGETRAGRGEVGKPVWRLRNRAASPGLVVARFYRTLRSCLEWRERAKPERATAKQVVGVGPEWPSRLALHPPASHQLDEPLLPDPYRTPIPSVLWAQCLMHLPPWNSPVSWLIQLSTLTSPVRSSTGVLSLPCLHHLKSLLYLLSEKT